MDRWDALLDHLAQGPRENGTAALQEATLWLLDTLRTSGLQAQLWEWTAHPWRLRLVGLGCFLAALAWAALVERDRPRWALAVAVLVPAWIVAELDFGLPLAGAVYPVQQSHVVATIPASGPPRQRLVFSAHLDTKTDLLDHVERAPIVFLAMPGAALMVAASLARLRWRARRLTRVTQAVALLVGGGMLVAQTGGALAPRRSPGATDDGASCAVLVELGRALVRAPLPGTEVELVFFTGEEIGLEGSRAWVRERLGRPGGLPTRAVNLDGVGEARPLLVMEAESSLLRSFAPDAHLLELLDRVHVAHLGVPVHRPFYSASTDARAFLEAGVPALSLSSDLEGHAIARGLHSAADSRARLRADALDAAVEVLAALARAVDAERP